MCKNVVRILACVMAMLSFTVNELCAQGWEKNDAVKIDPVNGEKYVVVNSENFPSQFRGWVTGQSGATTTVDGEVRLYMSDALNVKSISFTYRDLASWAGFEYFTEVTNIDLHANRLSKTPPALPKLKSLNLQDCHYATFSADLPALEDLNLHSNYLTSIDVSNMPNLKFLSCGDNKLTELNVTNNHELVTLACDLNKLTSLDLSNNTHLRNLYMIFNPLSSGIDLSGNPELQILVVAGCNLSSLDLSNNKHLTCVGVMLNSIDVESMQSLVNSLPEYDGTILNYNDGDFIVIDYNSLLANNYNYDGNIAEMNHMTADQVAQVKAKNWEVKYTKPDSSELLDYPGDPAKGDSNEDGSVNTGDISMLYSIVTGASKIYERNGDLNGDGVINTGDISNAYNIILDGE